MEPLQPFLTDRCIQCGAQYRDHKAETRACPIGYGTRYHDSWTFTGAEAKVREIAAEQVAPTCKPEWTGSGNYIADREQAPQWVAFANGRTVSVAIPEKGSPYLVIGILQKGETGLRTMAAAETDAGFLSVGGMVTDLAPIFEPVAGDAPQIPPPLDLKRWHHDTSHSGHHAGGAVSDQAVDLISDEAIRCKHCGKSVSEGIEQDCFGSKNGHHEWVVPTEETRNG
jgi:DNA-directed RNA polymerase subunit RPC12/RpoP